MTTPRTAKELAEYIPTDAFNLRNQLKTANGQVHFDQSTDELSPEQLAVWLPRYLSGRGQLKGEKRQRVEALLAKITTNETPTKRPTKQHKQTLAQPIEKANERPIQQAINNSFFAKDWFVLAALIGCLVVQIRHFSFYYAYLTQGETPDLSGYVFGALLGTFAESFGITYAINGRKRFWVLVVAAVSLTINCLLTRIWERDLPDGIGTFLIDAIVPGCIYGFSALYLERNK